MVGSNKYLSYKCSRIKFYIFGYIKNMQTITYIMQYVILIYTHKYDMYKYTKISTIFIHLLYIWVQTKRTKMNSWALTKPQLTLN